MADLASSASHKKASFGPILSTDVTVCTGDSFKTLKFTDGTKLTQLDISHYFVSFVLNFHLVLI